MEKPQRVAGNALNISKGGLSLSVQVTLNQFSLVQTKYKIASEAGFLLMVIKSIVSRQTSAEGQAGAEVGSCWLRSFPGARGLAGHGRRMSQNQPVLGTSGVLGTNPNGIFPQHLPHAFVYSAKSQPDKIFLERHGKQIFIYLSLL